MAVMSRVFFSDVNPTMAMVKSVCCYELSGGQCELSSDCVRSVVPVLRSMLAVDEW